MNALTPYLTTIKLAAGIALLVAAFLFGRHVGAQSGQLKVAKAETTIAKTDARAADLATKASEAARADEHRQARAFDAISTHYLEANSHAYPSIADALPGAVADGSLQLRDACPSAPASPNLSQATARARAADAAATQALADRVKNSIAAVQAGEDADTRERQYATLITSLREVLNAEREHHKVAH